MQSGLGVASSLFSCLHQLRCGLCLFVIPCLQGGQQTIPKALAEWIALSLPSEHHELLIEQHGCTESCVPVLPFPSFCTKASKVEQRGEAAGIGEQPLVYCIVGPGCSTAQLTVGGEAGT